MDTRSAQPEANPPGLVRTGAVVSDWLLGIVWLSAAVLSCWLPSGWETTVKDARTTPPEVMAVELSVWSPGSSGEPGVVDSDRQGNGSLFAA
jgi:hypothetical protein